MSEPVRILIIEDSRTDIELAQREIHKSIPVCVFACAETREDMLAALDSFQPDLIVSDYHMPHFDGMTALKLAQENAPLTPLIIWTGSLNEDIAVECMKAGASNYVIKEQIKRLGPAVVHALEEKQVQLERRRAEDALRESEERFRSLYESMTELVALHEIVYDSTGQAIDYRILDCNPSFIKSIGIAREQAVGALASMLYGTATAPYLDIYARVATTGKPADFETYFLPMQKHFSISAFSPRKGCFATVTSDITDRKRAEERIRAEAARAETLVRIAARLNATLELDVALQAVGEEIIKALGTPLVNIFLYDESSDQLSSVLVTGMPGTAGMPSPVGMHIPIHRQMLEEFSQHNTLSIFTIPSMIQGTTLSQSTNHAQAGVLSLTTALMKHHEQLVGAIAVGAPGQDRVLTADEQALFQGIADQAAMAVSNARLFTQQKIVEEALRASEERYRTLAETANDLIFTIGADDTLRYVNSFGLRTFNVEWPDVIGRKVSEMIIEPLNELKAQGLNRVIQAGQPIKIENCIPAPSGEVWFSTSLVPLKDDTGRIDAVLGISRDISEQKRAEQALRESEARYRARSQELETLFTLSSHLRETQSADEMLRVVLHEMQRVLNADACEITLPDRTGDHLVVAFAVGEIAPDISDTFSREEGIAGLVMRTGETYVTPTAATAPYGMPPLPPADHGGPTIFAPLRSEKEVLGVLMATRAQPYPGKSFTPEEVRLLTAMGEMAGNALRRVRLFDDVQRHLRRTQSLHDIQLVVAGSFDLPKTLAVVLENVVSQLNVDAAAVVLFNSQTNMLEYASRHGFKPSTSQPVQVRLHASLAGRTILERRMVYLPNLNQVPGDDPNCSFLAREGFSAYCGVPLIAKGQIKGVLEVFHRTPLALDQEQLSFLETLAGQIAVGIDNLTLFTDLQDSHIKLAAAYDATIESLSRALDLRDKETEDHAQRVTELTVQLAREIGMNNAELLHVRHGALLHDMGKLGIPDAILLKPDKLTEEEWEIMRRHPQYAFDMFAPIEYLRPALEIPYCHHEKWDGTGYPRGLKGAEIPLSARVFAVVDVWDALTSERSYRHAWSTEQALAYIREQAGKHFDPRVTEVFLRQIESASN